MITLAEKFLEAPVDPVDSLDFEEPCLISSMDTACVKKITYQYMTRYVFADGSAIVSDGTVYDFAAVDNDMCTCMLSEWNGEHQQHCLLHMDA
jgi:hypothetical protein